MKAKSFAVFGVVIIIGVLVLQAVGRLPFLDQWLGHLSPFKTQPTTIAISDAIVTDIKQVSELTTTIYTIQKVDQDGKEKGWAWWHIIIVEKGTVEAGLDLTQLDASNVSVSEDGKSITVNLPPVMILTDRDYILSSNREDTYRYEFASWLWINPPDADKAEATLREKAGDSILETACKDGILQEATTDAKVTIEKLLKTTTPNYNITVVSAPVPSLEECKAKIPTD